MKVLACIPARYGSTRFAGKVLAKDTGKFLIQHTYERACLAKLPDKVIIVADDERIAAAAKSFHAECILTSAEHKSGADRIAEAVADIDVEIVLNLQADEPEIDPANIDFLAELLMKTQDSRLKTQDSGLKTQDSGLKAQDYAMATLATDFQSPAQIADPNIVKVIISTCARDMSDERRATSDEIGRAIYFSRAPVPYDREKSGVGSPQQYLRHIGIYAYRKELLLKITALPQTKLEKIEKLEQLRAIEYGFDILVGKVKHTCDGIDTLEQYVEFVKRHKERRSRSKIRNPKHEIRNKFE